MNLAMKEHVNVRSFRRFISETLPAALAQVMSLADYQAREVADGVGEVRLAVANGKGQCAVTYEGLPFPLADGTFAFNGGEHAVIMTASSNDLAAAEIKAVGEQLADEILPRLVRPPADFEWSEETLRSWLPLDHWLRAFLMEAPTAFWLDTTNAYARQTHARRIWILGDDTRYHPSQRGRACPFNTPEGPNNGRILHLAAGADVVDRRIATVDPSPEGALGMTACMVPLLSHNDPSRLMMGVNMIRQWIPQEPAEPALVQSGHEPTDGSGWFGRNFFTAYLPWKMMNYEDAIVVSESAAARMTSPHPLEVGDKLANRHGAKGVVGAILPDDEMPHLPDGRAVDLVFDSHGVYSRLDFGQIVEAALGNVAQARGEPVIAPPFGGPDSAALREMLRSAGLPESGQWTLSDGKGGPPLDQPSTVGYVYWGRLVHLSASKLRAFSVDPPSGMRAGVLEYLALKTAGAFENIRDEFDTRSIRQEQPRALLTVLDAGPLPEPPQPPSRAFRRLQRILAAAGIAMKFDGDAVHFSVMPEPGLGGLPLPVGVPHPWIDSHWMWHLGPTARGLDGYHAAEQAAMRLSETPAAAGGPPPSVRETAAARLRQAVAAMFAGLPDRDDVTLAGQALFTGKTALSPGYDLKPDEIGVPEGLAWPLFEPYVIGRVGREAAQARTAKARKALAEVMAENLVIINRAPTWEPTCIVALQPVLREGLTLRLHPLCCRMLNADYDGDQAAIWLPVSRAAQEEARERLTILGHLRRDPSALIQHLTPSHALLYGLAWLTRSAESRDALRHQWPEGLAFPDRQIDRAWLADALYRMLPEAGPEAVVEAVTRLAILGAAAATQSGASFSPFAGTGLRIPAQPADDYATSWSAWTSLADAVIMTEGPGDPTLAPAVLAAQSGARGSVAHLRAVVAGKGVEGPFDPTPPIRSNLRDGLAADDLWARIPPARAGLHGLVQDISRFVPGLPTFGSSLRPVGGDSPLGRAMRSDQPGRVLAEAAARGESDPLTDPDVRLFVGLLPLARP